MNQWRSFTLLRVISPTLEINTSTFPQFPPAVWTFSATVSIQWRWILFWNLYWGNISNSNVSLTDSLLLLFPSDSLSTNRWVQFTTVDTTTCYGKVCFSITSLLVYSGLHLSALLQIEFGVVYSCLEDKMFTARRGKGAFCNGEPLQVSDQEGQ